MEDYKGQDVALKDESNSNGNSFCPNAAATSGIQPISLKDPPKRQYICYLCKALCPESDYERQFRSMRGLKMHMKIHDKQVLSPVRMTDFHSGCAFCKRTFLSENCLETHILQNSACKSVYLLEQEAIYVKSEMSPILPIAPKQSVKTTLPATQIKKEEDNKTSKKFVNLFALLNDVQKEIQMEIDEEDLEDSQTNRSTCLSDDKSSTTCETNALPSISLESSSGEFSSVTSSRDEIINLPIDEMKIYPETGRKRFNCTKCHRSFVNKYCFEAHVKIEHNGEKPLACKLCNQTFSLEISLNKHISNKICAKANLRKLKLEISKMKKKLG